MAEQRPTSGLPMGTPWPHPWPRRMLRHVAYALVLGSAVALVLVLLFPRSSWRTWVFSWCIAMGCSVSIDVLRHLASAWVYRHDTEPSLASQSDWPGWGWMSVCLVLGTTVGFTGGAELAGWMTGAKGSQLFSGGQDMGVGMLLISLIPGVGATFYFHSRGQLQTAKAQAEAAQRQAAETKLKLLESQLEPHMLFNTLANLRALISIDPERAQAMLDRLIDFLRATLGASRTSMHPLSAEFSRLADYLALMQIRMGDRLQVELDLPPSLAANPVPPLLLQPLVENAIKHGLEPRRGPGLIRVEARVEAADLVLRVSDTGVGLQPARSGPDSAAPAGSGFGLVQVRERLATLYGERASLQMAPGSGTAGGTVVTLRWPLASIPSTQEPQTP
ncbi:histidine kinase [Ideonella sp. DXS29W]|uniref:histidine kinase n=1 Tax=Ideonella lacteola TaxID=2984193 RepID=A0ABU9BT88_9BURK